MEPTIRTISQSDWVTLLLFGSLLFVILAKSFFYTRFLNFCILPFNDKYISVNDTKEKLFNWFHILLTLFQVINTALFLSITWQTYFEPSSKKNSLLFLFILLSVFIFISIKTLLQLSNGFIFGSYKTFKNLIFRRLTYLNYSGLILFMGNVLLTYIFVNSTFVILFSLVLFLIINLVGWITAIKNNMKFISSYILYFILYLCALEIAPLVILGNFLK